MSKRREIIYPDGMVVPDRELRAAVGGIRSHKLALLIESFNLITDATAVSVEDRIDDWSLRLIKQVGREVRCKRCRAVIRAIALAVEDGHRGIAAAREYGVLHNGECVLALCRKRSESR